MVSFEALKATSKTLKNLLDKNMESGADVIISRPTNKTPGSNQIKLFLFQVMENKFLRNTDGSRLWLILNYLLTPYGVESVDNDDGVIDDEIFTQVILGDAMRVFHDYPIIQSDSRLLDSRLKDSIEEIKITPLPMTLEELSHIWNPLTGDFRLSVAYQVSVVQIDSKKEKRYPAPVRLRKFGVFPFKRPQIIELRPKRIFFEDETHPPSLTILGRDLYSPDRVVKIGDKPCEEDKITDLNGGNIKVEIHPEVLPGPHIVEIMIPHMRGKEYGFISNQDNFILVPLIKEIIPPEEGEQYVTIRGTKLCDPRDPPEFKTTIHLGEFSVEPDMVNCPSVIYVDKEKFIDLEPKLPDVIPVSIRVRVNGIESFGESLDFGEEKIWFYDKNQLHFKDKIIEDKITVEVLRDE